MPLFILHDVTRKGRIRGISDVGFNPRMVHACYDSIYSPVNALLLEKWAMLFFRQRILLTLQDHNKHFCCGIEFEMVRVGVTRATMRVESTMTSISIINNSDKICNVNKGVGFWSTPDCSVTIFHLNMHSKIKQEGKNKNKNVI